MTAEIRPVPLTAEAFAPFGKVIEADGPPSFMINGGLCGRYHDLARPNIVDSQGEIALSVGRSDAVSLPLELKMMEHHPEGSQAFVPMQESRFLVVVAPDDAGKPGAPRAFVTNGHQGVQYDPGCWHGVLAPLEEAADFLIVDRVGPGPNLVEHHFDKPYSIIAR